MLVMGVVKQSAVLGLHTPICQQDSLDMWGCSAFLRGPPDSILR